MADLIIRPNGEGTTQDWDLRSSYVYIDDDVEQPDAATGGTDTCRNANPYSTNEWTLEDISASGTTSNFRVWWYLSSNPFTTPMQWSVKVDGTWQTLSTGNSDVTSWEYVDFSISHTYTGPLTGLGLRCVSGNIFMGAYFDLDAAYVVVTAEFSSGASPTWQTPNAKVLHHVRR